jgi:hypothetical protein
MAWSGSSSARTQNGSLGVQMKVVATIALLIGVLAGGSGVALAATDIADLRHAYDDALASARGSDSLDPAFELLGVAGTAHGRKVQDVDDGATRAFIDLVQRATAAAHKKGGSLARDTLDQFVDLRFFAHTSEIEAAMAALDGAMRDLFPVVSTSLQQQIDSASDWDDKLGALRDLAALQASAVQVLQDDVASAIGSSLDMKIAQMEQRLADESDDAERARRLGDLAELKRSRADQINDARANNVNAVAGQANDPDQIGNRVQSEAGAAVPPDLAAGDESCIETAYLAPERKPAIAGKLFEPSDPSLHRVHDRDCVNSGRVPSTVRCSTANLALACYAPLPGGEKITYVYRNTPEEAYFRKSCAADGLVPGTKIPSNGAPFRRPDVALAFVCAPSGSDNAGD